MSDASTSDLTVAFTPIVLPCGRSVPNRFVKAAMYEHMASPLGGPPNARLNALYSTWAHGGWGMIITGNVQVDARHLSLGRDVVIPKAGSVDKDVTMKFTTWANCIKRTSEGLVADDGQRPLAIMQLNHTGRQSPNIIGGRLPFVAPLSASATRVGSSSRTSNSPSFIAKIISFLVYALLFRTAREMTRSDIDEVAEAFVRGARLAAEAGFDGVQVHAAHGYLLAQFMSRKTNLRSDEYAHPLALLRHVVTSIRGAVPPSFIVSIKLNTSDYVSDEGDYNAGSQAREHLREIAEWGVDFVEISGGDYERPDFTANPSARQAFFESFSRTAVSILSSSSTDKLPLILLTGGLRSPSQMSSALLNNHAHLLGLGRISVIHPDFPQQLKLSTDSPGTALELEPESSQYPEPRSAAWYPRIIGAGIGTGWYTVTMNRRARLGEPMKVPYGLGTAGVLAEMYLGISGDLVETWRLVILTSAAILLLAALVALCQNSAW